MVDLKKITPIDRFSLECLQDTRSWIIFPTNVSYYGSMDGKIYEEIASMDNQIKADNYDVQVQRFEKKMPLMVNYRYIKITAKNFGKLPEWHAGKGDEAFIFVSEIVIE